MSTEGNSYEALDLGNRDNPPPRYDNAASHDQQFLPEMDTTQPTFYPPPPDYLEVPPVSQPGGMVNPPPYYLNNPSEGSFSEPMVIPSPVDIYLPQSSNNQQIIQQTLPMYNPESLTPQTSKPTRSKAFLSPPPTMIPGMAPPLQDPQNCPVPGTVINNTVQPMVVTTQTTEISTPAPPCKDYLAWSIVSLILGFVVFGIVALIFSIQTRSAKRRGNWELAMKKSSMSLCFNVVSLFLASSAVGIAVGVSRGMYRPYYYYSYSG